MLPIASLSGQSPVLFGARPAIRSVVDYRQLSQIDRQDYQSGMEEMKLSDVSIDKLSRMAQSFASRYPEDAFDVFAFGRSALPFMEIVTAIEGGRNTYTPVYGSSFRTMVYGSGIRENFALILGHDEDAFQAWLRQYRDTRNHATDPTPENVMSLRENLHAYKRYLTAKQFDPASIIARANAGKRSVLVDGVAGGASLKNLAMFLHQWAKETGQEATLGQSLAFHMLLPSYVCNSKTQPIKDLGFEVNTTDKTMDENITHILIHMNANGYGMGLQYLLSKAKELLREVLRQEQADELIEKASLVRFKVMSVLERINKLREPPPATPTA